MQTGRDRRIAIADDSPMFVEAAARYVAALPGYALAGTVHATTQAVARGGSAAPDRRRRGLGGAPAGGRGRFPRPPPSWR